MFVERLLQINLAMLAALGAILLGMGQRDAAMPLCMLIVATCSVLLTDVTGWFRLHRTVAGAAAFIAVCSAFYQTRQLEGENLLLAIANLLVILQAILLFQTKDDRIYAQVAVLCLMEAVVSTLFAQGVWFGLLLGVEMFAGLVALALMFLVRQMRPFSPVRVASPGPAPSTGPVPPLRRWPLGAKRPEFHGVAAGSLRPAFGAELFRRLASISVVTLAISMLIFFVMPRLSESAWRGVGASKKSLVGFNDSITLGELGDILENPEEVMRVRLVEMPDAKVLTACSEVYLRGALLNRYERGRWSYCGGPAVSGKRGPPAPYDSSPPVLQQITIEPLDRPELFCVWPFSKFRQDSSVLYEPSSQRLCRHPRRCGQRFSYILGTAAFPNGQQAALTPCAEFSIDEYFSQIELEGLPRLKALAAAWLEASKLTADDHVGRARYLEAMLRDSGKFEYSLEGQDRNLQIDPIEDFLTEHRKGHCEYFNTALAMMLRAQGIPSRVVVGYRSSEFNDVGKFFQVRQLHAHTWVEAYLPVDELPAELLEAEDSAQWLGGGWLRLDATPGAAERAASVPFLPRIAAKYTWIRELWENYILEMDRQRQLEAIYEPIAAAARAVYERLASSEWWLERLDSILAAITPAWLKDGQRGVVAALAGLGLLATIGIGWGLQRRLRGFGVPWGRRRRGDRPAGASEVDFYKRFESLLARRGLRRARGQTQREFVLAAAGHLAAAQEAPAADTLIQVAELFYRVRFGRLPLDNPQRQTVEQALCDLESKPPNKEQRHVR